MSADVQARHDTAVSIRNGLVVGVSLLATWTVALIFRLVLPRHLGPDLFGQYNFAEALAANGFGFISLGIDNYIQKEIPARPEHASDFFGGAMVTRLLASAFVFLAIGLIAHATGYSQDVVLATLLFGCANLMALIGGTCGTILYAARRVGRLSALNISSKLLWGGGIALALWQGTGLWSFALVSFLTEGLRAAVLLNVVRSTTKLALRIDRTATWQVLRSSSPYYVNGIAMALYAKIDVAIMGSLVPGVEVGYYGAATNLSAIAMMVAPLFSWVLMPQLSLAAARGRPVLMEMLRRTFDWTFVFGAGVAVVIGATADVLVHTLFGGKFDAAIPALRALSPTFLFVYLAMLGATALILLNRPWTTTTITIASFVFNATLNLLFLKSALAYFGVGGAGIGAAIITASSEGLVVVALFSAVGRESLDRTNVVNIVKCVVACAVVLGVNYLARDLTWARLALDTVTYLVVVTATGALRLREAAGLVRDAFRRRRGGDAPVA